MGTKEPLRTVRIDFLQLGTDFNSVDGGNIRENAVRRMDGDCPV